MSTPRGDARFDILIVIGLLMLLGFAWVYTGGPGHYNPFQNGAFFKNPLLGNGSAISVPEVPLANEKNKTGGSQYNHFTAGSGTGTVGTPQSYAGEVKLQVGTASLSDPKAEYIIIETSLGLKSDITITGWTLENSTGVKKTIGSATPVFVLGKANNEDPITVGPGSAIVVVTGHSPNGESFRVNECSGYLSQFQNFTPRLRAECPSPLDDMHRFVAGASNGSACANFVSGIDQCTLTTVAPSSVGSSCQDFILNTLSYNGCVSAHKNDAGFYRNEWRVFLGSDTKLWGVHDRIVLLDENEKVVASINY